ncbi:MAG: DegV family EDD domain-containing protein [Fusobacteriaceae bacterium]|jgi:DegV family protein with EDD domain|nr:DegV family EDD domain-containing protein [Fusobacteriaceae bacterium]
MKIEIKVLNAMRFTKLFIAASRWVSKYADVLNDINVFPAPDGDTGTNISMTLQAVENELVKLDHEPDMREFVDVVSEAALMGAKGTSGIIFANLLAGFLSTIADKEDVTIRDVAAAFVEARERVYAAVAAPVEGTILTVLSEVANSAVAYEGDPEDFILFLVYLKNVAWEALQKTPEQFPLLRENGVVDAGGMGFFYLLESFEKSVSDPEMLKDLERIIKSQAIRSERLKQIASGKQTSKYKYNLEFLLESDEFDVGAYKKKIARYGDILYCVQIGRKTKTQIHTDAPWELLKIGDKSGRIYNINLENLQPEGEAPTASAVFQPDGESGESQAEEADATRLIDTAVVTDSGSDLTEDVVKDLRVSIIPLKLKVRDNYYSDGTEFTKKEIWTLYRKELIFPKVTPPSPTEFKNLYDELFQKGYKKIISIHIANSLSGTQQAAKVARGMFENKGDIAIIDSRSLSLPLGHLVLKAAKMIENGANFDDVVKKINDNIGKMDVYLFSEDLSYLQKNKRVSAFAGSWGRLAQYRIRLKLKDETINYDGAHFGYRSIFKYVRNLLRDQYAKNRYIVYSLWGGGADELLKTNEIKEIVLSLSGNLTYAGNFQIGSSIANASGPVFGFGIIQTSL